GGTPMKVWRGRSDRWSCKRSAALGAMLMVALWSQTAINARADQGGKAEPTRIQFARGRDSATLRGVVRDDAQKEYAFTARKGQRLTLALSAEPARSLSVTAK